MVHEEIFDLCVAIFLSITGCQSSLEQVMVLGVPVDGVGDISDFILRLRPVWLIFIVFNLFWIGGFEVVCRVDSVSPLRVREFCRTSITISCRKLQVLRDSRYRVETDASMFPADSISVRPTNGAKNFFIRPKIESYLRQPILM